jgi:hypothetical protein
VLHVAEVHPRGRVFRAQGQGALEGCGGVLKPVLVQPHQTQADLGFGQLGTDREGALEGRGGGVRLALSAQDEAEIVMGLD